MSGTHVISPSLSELWRTEQVQSDPVGAKDTARGTSWSAAWAAPLWRLLCIFVAFSPGLSWLSGIQANTAQKHLGITVPGGARWRSAFPSCPSVDGSGSHSFRPFGEALAECSCHYSCQRSHSCTLRSLSQALLLWEATQYPIHAVPFTLLLPALCTDPRDINWATPMNLY